MDAERYRRAKELLLEALDRPPAEREGYVVGACGDDDALVREVTSLLAQHDQPVAILDHGLADLQPGTRIASRYEVLGGIGSGATGRVLRVHDHELDRDLAMKVLHLPLVVQPTARLRFSEEAQATARLQHPNIVPIHDVGQLDDGRPWFTMREVRGRTLARWIGEAHRSGGAVNLRGLLAAFLAICRAVAHAHERGVIHRDLKPSNVMVGDLGEVYVLDWGLCKVLGRPDRAGAAGDLDAVRGPERTQEGHVVGTPAFMPPEQARGEVDRIDARSDVYALGAMLFMILAGEPPYAGDDAAAVVARVVAGAREPLPAGVPAPLGALCDRAMAARPDDRHRSAQELARDVEAWLDGAQRRERALQVVERARAIDAEARALAQRAEQLRAESEAMLEVVAPWQPEDDKAEAWARADEARTIAQDAALRQVQVDQELHGALQLAPDLPEAHLDLAARYRARHEAAEALRDEEGASTAELHLRTHLEALPPHHRARAGIATYLRGDGALTLVTDPPGAQVTLFRYHTHRRRLVERFERELGVTPLRQIGLPMGSYLCRIRREGHADVRYPVRIGRLAHWHGVRPGDHDPHPIWLPALGELGPDEIYVPAGWFRSGGDPEAFQALPVADLWCDGFVVERTPVTNHGYIAFLDDLVARGREEEALLHAPRERGPQPDVLGHLIYARDDAGRFGLRPDADGDEWPLDGPVLHVTWRDARAMLAWRARRTGRPWRLPAELEWEKAARGVDGRWYPWGDALDAAWARIMPSMRGREHGDYGPRSVESYPVDASPYGVRGLGGNVRDWCLDAEPHVESGIVVPTEGDPGSEARRAVRGGSWTSLLRYARSADRVDMMPDLRQPSIGFRGCWSLPGQGPDLGR